MVIELIFDTQQVFGTVCGQVGELAEGMTFIAPSLPKCKCGFGRRIKDPLVSHSQ